MSLPDQQIKRFIARHRLPKHFHELVDRHYSRLVTWLQHQKGESETLLVGINGAQGTGKSTLAAYLQLALETSNDWRVAILAIDDFYLTGDERRLLAANVHPLLETRGVPGTHDIAMLATCLEQLRHLDKGATLSLPHFDKMLDDRTNPEKWPIISGPVDLIILEGWCVGSLPQSDEALAQPVNTLERERDASGQWRVFINNQLGRDYASLFAQLDAMIVLKAPDFSAVHRWRLKQELKLAESVGTDPSNVMSEEQVASFVQHFERLTRANLATLPARADVVLEFNQRHECVRSIYQTL